MGNDCFFPQMRLLTHHPFDEVGCDSMRNEQALHRLNATQDTLDKLVISSTICSYLACPALNIIDAMPVHFSLNHSLLHQTGDDLTSAFAKKALSLHQCVPNHKHQCLSLKSIQMYRALRKYSGPLELCDLLPHFRLQT